MIIFFNKFKSYLKNNKWIFLVILAVVILPSLSYAWGVGDSVKEGFVAIIRSIIQIWYDLSSLALWFSGYIIDNALAIGISPSFLKMPFIDSAWSNIRNLVNIGFIFGVLYIVYLLIRGESKWHEKLINLIIAIFVMNFSLLAGRIIIDAGSLTTKIFYRAVGQVVYDQKGRFDIAYSFTKQKIPIKPEEGFLSISGKIISEIAPEKIVDGSGKLYQVIKGEDSKLVYFIALMVIAIIINYLFIKHFFQVAFIFLFRTINLVMYLILSPIFVLGMFFDIKSDDLAGEKGGVNFSSWASIMFTKSFCIVFYFLYIWMLLMILEAQIIQISDGSSRIAVDDPQTYTIILAGMAFKVVFAFIMLNAAKKVVEKECAGGKALEAFNKIKGMAMSGVSAVAGLAMGAASGGTTLAAGAIGRRAAGMMAKDAGRLSNRLGNSKSWLGRRVGDGAYNIQNTLETTKFNGKSVREWKDAAGQKEKDFYAFRKKIGGKEVAKKSRIADLFGVKNLKSKNAKKRKKSEKKLANKIEKFTDSELNQKMHSLMKRMGKDAKKVNGKWKLSKELKEDAKKYGFDNAQEMEDRMNNVAGKGDSAEKVAKNAFTANNISKRDDYIDPEKDFVSTKKAVRGGVLGSVYNKLVDPRNEVARDEMNEATSALADQKEEQLELDRKYKKSVGQRAGLKYALSGHKDRLNELVTKGMNMTGEETQEAKDILIEKLGSSEQEANDMLKEMSSVVGNVGVARDGTKYYSTPGDEEKINKLKETISKKAAIRKEVLEKMGDKELVDIENLGERAQVNIEQIMTKTHKVKTGDDAENIVSSRN